MNKKTDPTDFAKALSDPTRQEIMKLCCCEWRSVGELADDLNVTQPTVSHHLAVLRDAKSGSRSPGRAPDVLCFEPGLGGLMLWSIDAEFCARYSGTCLKRVFLY